jgi:SAM-dependent methyltransferase
VSGRTRRDRREAALARLGIAPPLGHVVRAALDAAVARAEVARAAAGEPAPAVAALDAGCGSASALARYRPRLGRFVGADLHAPLPGALHELAQFIEVDLCRAPGAFAPATFDVVLGAFTVEHLADPPAAFANVARWLRPGGTLVLTTVNRRHPFVAVYLGLPAGLRSRLQRLVKATTAEAHSLVGACNDPATLRRALAAAGFVDIRVQAVGHLGRAWRRHALTFAAGVTGDLVARRRPSRRSTLVVSARAPELPA